MKKIILAIETSCDETAASLIRAETKSNSFEIEVLSNVVASQIDIHKEWGGVWPELASRAHLESMISVLKKALEPTSYYSSSDPAVRQEVEKSETRTGSRQARTINLLDEVDAIAVTQGPGLIGSLLMGTETANILGAVYKKPIIPVNHLEGHIYSAFSGENPKKCHPEFISGSGDKMLKHLPECIVQAGVQHDNLLHFQISKSENLFPILALVVSGGHTSLILMKDHLQYETVAQTIDDAAGEAFDKVAKLMGLGYPGGPLIEELAQTNADGTQTNADKYPLPIAMPNSLDFSFSGLKTAVLYLVKPPTDKYRSSKVENNSSRLAPLARRINKADLAASFQKTVVDTLILKTQKAIEKYQPKTVILSGGVSANGYLRERFVNEINPVCHPELVSGSTNKMPKRVRHDIKILIPPKNLSTDNAVGIAIAAALKNSFSNYVEADPNLRLG